MTTTAQTIAEALHRCAEIKDNWCDQPGNEPPIITAAQASHEWWERWFTSSEKAECDRILSETGLDQLFPSHMPPVSASTNPQVHCAESTNERSSQGSSEWRQVGSGRVLGRGSRSWRIEYTVKKERNA